MVEHRGAFQVDAIDLRSRAAGLDVKRWKAISRLTRDIGASKPTLNKQTFEEFPRMAGGSANLSPVSRAAKGFSEPFLNSLDMKPFAGTAFRAVPQSTLSRHSQAAPCRGAGCLKRPLTGPRSNARHLKVGFAEEAAVHCGHSTGAAPVKSATIGEEWQTDLVQR